MSEPEKKIIAYIIDEGKVKPIIVLEETKEVVVEETVVAEGY